MLKHIAAIEKAILISIIYGSGAGVRVLILPLPNPSTEVGRSNRQRLHLLRLETPRLLSGKGSNHIHQIGTQTIISLQLIILKLLPHIPHLLRIEALLNNTAHESRELRFLPSLLIA